MSPLATFLLSMSILLDVVPDYTCGTCVLHNYEHLGTGKKCPDYQGVLISQVILYDEVPFWISLKCEDYAGVLVFKCPH